MDETTTPPKPPTKRYLTGTKRGQFQRGHSGNPSGPKKSLAKTVAEAVREKSHNGLRWVKELDKIAMGKETTKNRLDAIRMLLERGFGRPPQEVQLSGGLVNFDSIDLKKLNDRQLEDLYAAQTKARELMVLAQTVPSDDEPARDFKVVNE